MHLQLVRRLGERPFRMDDPATRRHPLRAARGHDPGMSRRIAMLVATRQEVRHGFDAGVRMRFDAIDPRRHLEGPEVVEEDPRPDRVAIPGGQGAPHGEGPDRGDLRAQHALDGARLLEDRAHRLSTLYAPGPKAKTMSMPP